MHIPLTVNYSLGSIAVIMCAMAWINANRDCCVPRFILTLCLGSLITSWILYAIVYYRAAQTDCLTDSRPERLSLIECLESRGENSADGGKMLTLLSAIFTWIRWVTSEWPVSDRWVTSEWPVRYRVWDDVVFYKKAKVVCKDGNTGMVYTKTISFTRNERDKRTFRSAYITMKTL